MFRAISKRAMKSFTANRSLQTAARRVFTRENIPAIGICVGITALSFQLVMLYPWHFELSEQFDDLQVQ